MGRKRTLCSWRERGRRGIIQEANYIMCVEHSCLDTAGIRLALALPTLGTWPRDRELLVGKPSRREFRADILACLGLCVPNLRMQEALNQPDEAPSTRNGSFST